MQRLLFTLCAAAAAGAPPRPPPLLAPDLPSPCFSADPPTCAEEEDPAEVCKQTPNSDGLGADSRSLQFFGRNFLFAPVYQPNPCDTKRTCETNSLGNPIG